MKVKTIFKVSDIDDSIDFYLNNLKLFKVGYKELNGIYCDLYTSNLTIHLTKNDTNFKANIIFMEVTNSYYLYNEFNKDEVMKNHIVRDFKKYKGKNIDFIRSPIGDSFSIEDLDKNRIVFFDSTDDTE